MRKTHVIAAIVVLLIALWIVFTFGSEGRVMATADISSSIGPGEITVREIPPGSRWLKLLAYAVDDRFWYRCEFRINQIPSIFSCVSYTGDSFHVRSVRLEVKANRDVVVFLDGMAVYSCNAKGDWSRL